MSREPSPHWQPGLTSIIIPVLELKRGWRLRNPLARRGGIAELLDDLERSTGVDLEIIVVCNSSDENLIELVTKDERIDKYCINSVNVGVARSWNMGAMMAEGEFLCYVNDDVEIAADSIRHQIEIISQDEEIGMVGPRGAMWPGLQPGEYVGKTSIADADAISGFMFVIRRAVLETIGGFDPAFTPAGCEEIDCSFAVRNAGFRCTVVPDEGIVHHGREGVSSREMDIAYLGKKISTKDLAERNLKIFKNKWSHHE